MNTDEWADLHGEPRMTMAQFEAEEARGDGDEHAHHWQIDVRTEEGLDGNIVTDVFAVCTIRYCEAELDQERIQTLINWTEEFLTSGEPATPPK